MPIRTDIASVLSGARPLFALARRGVAEIVISGVAYFKAEGRKLHGAQDSDPNVMIIARSLLKPWQFLAADLMGEGADADEPYLALGLASHSGQAHHMEALARLCEVAGAGEEELFCPRGYPLDPGVSSVMQNSGIRPTRMHHPCSGKHLVHLASCRAHDYPLDGYWDSEHPIQKRLAGIIGSQVGEKPIWMTDSCGLPTLAITAKAHVNLWERLGQSDDPKQRRLKQLWTANLRLVGGYGRLESDLMEVAKGRLLAKEGADGLLVLTSLPSGGEQGATVLIKLASGYSSTYLALALWSTLSSAPDLPPLFEQVQEYLRSRLERWVPGDQELILPPFEAHDLGEAARVKTLTATVTAPDDGKRLDVFLAAQELGLSRRKLRQVIDIGGVYVNKKRVRIASWEVRRGDLVRVEYSEEALVRVKTRAFALSDADVLWEGEDVFALAKPPGLPAQATKDQSVQHVVPLLAAWLKAKGRRTKKLLLVHRLDKETSGLILVAAGAERATWLTEQFRARKVKKTYLAICHGRPGRAEWTETAALSEIDKKSGDVRAVRAGGRSAVTHFRVLATRDAPLVCLVECRPETGRSHQIRVHLELQGLPIVGDKRYGAASRGPLPSVLGELAAEHHFLHAAALVLQPAEGVEAVRLTCPPPPRFREFALAAGLQPPDAAGK